MLPIILLAISLLLALTGMILVMASLWYRAPNHPSVTGERPIRGLLFWKYKHLWNPPGYKLYIWGTILFCAGMLYQVIYNLFLTPKP